MPILDIGYREWNGKRTSRLFRWMVIAWSGIVLVWSGTGLRRVLMLSTIPALLAGLAIGVFEQATIDSDFKTEVIRNGIGRSIDRAPRDSSLHLLQPVLERPEQHRHLAWSYLLHWYFRYPQAGCVVVLLGLVAPRLISFDLRSRGYLLYLSRPLTPWGYILGKVAVLFFLLFMITTGPALLVYFAGLMMSNSPDAFYETWDIPIRILLSTAVLTLPTCAMALALTSLTEESRFAGFGWFAMWIVGWVTFFVLSASAVGRGEPLTLEIIERCMYFSPYHLLGHLQREVFGLMPEGHPTLLLPWIVCISVTIVGFGIAHWRVSRMLKI